MAWEMYEAMQLVNTNEEFKTNVEPTAGTKMHPCSSFFATIKPYLYFEPAYLLFNLAVEISELTKANLYLQKRCRYNTFSEPDISTPCDDERAGVNFVASVNSKALFTANLVGTSLIVLLAAWSDKAEGRRKFCILLTMVIKTLQLISMLLQSYFWRWSVWYAVVTEGLCNAVIAMRVASMIYICSVSSKKERIFRMTLLNVLQTFCSIISSGSSGYLLQQWGFRNTYFLSVTLATISVIHVGFFLKNERAADSPPKQRSGRLQRLCDVFDLRSIFDAFKLFFKKRDGNERAVVWLLSLLSILAWSSYGGEQSVLYLYLRYKFCWNEQDYGFYYLYKLVGYNIGNILCLGMSKFLKITDYALGTFSAFWTILAAVGFIFATENWHLYLLPLFEIFRFFSINVCDSLQSKFFENNEFGRMFSIHEALNIAISITFPMYNLLFQYTMDFAPSSIFIMSAAINLCVCVLYCICFMLMKTSTKSKKQEIFSVTESKGP